MASLYDFHFFVFCVNCLRASGGNVSFHSNLLSDRLVDNSANNSWQDEEGEEQQWLGIQERARARILFKSRIAGK